MSKDKATNKDFSEAEKSQTKQDPPPTALGWAARAISIGLVLALLGYLVATGLSSKEPASVNATPDVAKIEQRNGQWVVPAVVVNEGDVSVSDATVTLSLVGDDGSVVESEEVAIVLLGQSGSVDVEYWFDHDPNDYDLQFDTGGLVVP